MKISSIPSPMTNFNPQGTQPESVHSLKMITNATPLSNPGMMPEMAQPGPTAAAPEDTKPLSPQMALLAKQRRELQRQKRELEIKQQELLSKSQAGDMIDVSRLKSEPLRVLLENGVTYDQLTKAIMEGQGTSEIHTLKAELAALKQGIDQKFVDQNAQAEKQVLAEMQREAKQLAGTDDSYELIRTMNGVPHVMSLIERTYRKTGEVLDVSEAMKLVEDELYKDAVKIQQLKKMQAQHLATPQYPQQRPTGMRTLTNRDTASSVPLSAKARALAAFYGTLPKR